MIIEQKPRPNPLLSNPRDFYWANEEKTLVDMTVDHSEFGEIQFTASADDIETHSRSLFEYALKNKEVIMPFDPKRYEQPIEVIEQEKVETIPAVEV